MENSAVHSLLEQMEKIGIQFVWTDLDHKRHSLHRKLVELALCKSNENFPIENVVFGVNDDDINKFLVWRNDPERPGCCFGKALDGKPCRVFLAARSVPIRDFEKHAFCKLHRPKEISVPKQWAIGDSGKQFRPGPIPEIHLLPKPTHGYEDTSGVLH